MKKKYLLFVGNIYYPSRGFDDFKGNFETITEMERYLDEYDLYDWCQIIDLGSLKEIFCAERDEIMKNGIVIGDE